MLSVNKYDSNYSSISEKTKEFEGREWLFSLINDWVEDNNGPRYFLITGKAGTGKSAIAAKLWEKYEYKNDQLNQKYDIEKKGFINAIHVCSARDLSSTDSAAFPIAISKQLMIKDIEFAKEIIEKSQQDFSKPKQVNINTSLEYNQAEEIIGINIQNLNINIGAISPKTLFNILVAQPLKNIYRNKEKRVVILVDGLDESPLGPDSITSLIANNYTLPPNVRFIITTRDYEEIIGKFSRDNQIISLSEEYYDKNNEDISKYVKSRIKNNSNLLQTYKEFDKDVIDKSGGIFLYVKFLFDAVDKGIFLPTKENLDKVPPFLDGLYNEFLNRIKLQNITKWEEDFQPLLSILSVAFQSLDQDQLSFLCRKHTSTINYCLDKLTPFIKEEESKYKIYHQSLIDFFRQQEIKDRSKDGKELKTDNMFIISEDEGHAKIVESYYDETGNLILEDKDNYNSKNIEKYSLKYLYEHLSKVINYRDPKRTNWYKRLLDLAKNEDFKIKQREHYPSEHLHLKTIKNAFQAALSKEDPLSMCEMLLLHAKQISKITKESPLDVLNSTTKNNEFDLLQKAWNIADLYDPERELLWYLLMIWDLKNRENISAARKTLDRLLQKKTTANIDKKYYRMFIFLVSSLQSDFENSLEKLYSSITDANDQLSFLTEDQYFNDINITTFLKNYSIVNKIKDPKLLADIVKKQIQANDFASALETASKMEDSYDYYKIMALSEIAEAQAKSGLTKEAASTFALSLEPISKITDHYYKSIALSFIASAQAKSGLTKEAASTFALSLETASKITDNSYKSRALSEIASAQIQANDFASALETASEIPDDYYKSIALSFIASAQAKSGLTKEAASTFALSLETASKITDNSYKSRALSFIASAQAKSGLTKEAVSTFTLSLESASKITDDFFKSIALSFIASDQTQVNDFASALETASKMKDDSHKTKALSAIAIAQAQANYFASALETASKMKEGFDSHKTMALSFIASAQAKSGLTKEAASTFALSVETASEILLCSSTSRALSEIASAQAKSGLTKEAVSTFALSLESASKITNDPEKYTALSEIASAQAKSGLTKEAASTFALSLESASKITDNSYKSRALSAIDIAQAQANDFASALETASKMKDSNDSYKSEVLSAIAIAQAQANDFTSALETASKMTDYDSHKSEVLSAIASAQIQANDFTSAFKTASKMRDDDPEKYTALSEIASAQAKSGLTKEAASTLDSAFKTALWIKYDSWKFNAFITIATAQAKIGLTKKAASTLDSAFKTASKMKDSNDSYKSEVLSAIAIAQAQANDFTSAFKTASKITDAHNKSEALSEIATAQAQANDFTSALETASKITDAHNKFDTLSAIAIVQAQANDFTSAFKTASKMTDDSFKAIALSGIASAQAKSGLTKEAASTFALSLETASKITDYYPKSEALSFIASAQIQANDFTSALETASKMTDDSYKSKTLIDIASAQAKNGLTKEAASTFASAFKTASKMTDDSHKSKALSEIASAQIQANDFTSALETASKMTDDSHKFVALSNITISQDKANLTKDVIITIESMNISKSDDWYSLSSNLLYSSKVVWTYLMNQCFEYHNIAFLVCSLICKRYKNKVHEIKHLILNFE